MSSVNTKKCKSCGFIKSWDSFYGVRDDADRLATTCKVCILTKKRGVPRPAAGKCLLPTKQMIGIVDALQSYGHTVVWEWKSSVITIDGLKFDIDSHGFRRDGAAINWTSAALTGYLRLLNNDTTVMTAETMNGTQKPRQKQP